MLILGKKQIHYIHEYVYQGIYRFCRETICVQYIEIIILSYYLKSLNNLFIVFYLCLILFRDFTQLYYTYRSLL